MYTIHTKSYSDCAPEYIGDTLKASPNNPSPTELVLGKTDFLATCCNLDTLHVPSNESTDTLISLPICLPIVDDAAVNRALTSLPPLLPTDKDLLLSFLDTRPFLLSFLSRFNTDDCEILAFDSRITSRHISMYSSFVAVIL